MAEPSKASTAARPLSPHLQVWRWHATMATSIFHRMTGVGNAIGAAFLSLWLVAVALAPQDPTLYDLFATGFGHWLGMLVLLGFTVSICYHLLNGIRHLFWDAGAGFDIATARRMSVLIFLGTVVLTVAIWAAAFWMGGL